MYGSISDKEVTKMKHEIQKIEIKPRKEGEAISNVHLFINGTEIRNIRKLEFKTEPNSVPTLTVVKNKKSGKEIKRFLLTDKYGNSRIAVKDENDRYLKLEYFIEHIGFDIIEGYADVVNGDKKINETNLELSVKVLTALSSAVKAIKC